MSSPGRIEVTPMLTVTETCRSPTVIGRLPSR